MANVDYFIIAEKGSGYEVDHYLFKNLYIALKGVFIAEQTGISKELISRMAKRNIAIEARTYKKLKRFFDIFDEDIFYELYCGIKDKSNKELKLFGKEFKEKYNTLFSKNKEKTKH